MRLFNNRASLFLGILHSFCRGRRNGIPHSCNDPVKMMEKNNKGNRDGMTVPIQRSTASAHAETVVLLSSTKIMMLIDVNRTVK